MGAGLSLSEMDDCVFKPHWSLEVWVLHRPSHPSLPEKSVPLWSLRSCYWCISQNSIQILSCSSMLKPIIMMTVILSSGLGSKPRLRGHPDARLVLQHMQSRECLDALGSDQKPVIDSFIQCKAGRQKEASPWPDCGCSRWTVVEWSEEFFPGWCCRRLLAWCAALLADRRRAACFGDTGGCVHSD